MVADQSSSRQDKEKTSRSKALLHISLILFILSWFIPALGNIPGFMIVMQTLPFIWFPLAWPILANMMFYIVYTRLNDDKEVSPWFPGLMLFMMIPASISLTHGVMSWGYIVWAVSGILLFADWLCSRKPQKRRLIVRAAVIICLVSIVGLVGLGLSQKKSDRYGFGENSFGVFYNTWGLR